MGLSVHGHLGVPVPPTVTMSEVGAVATHIHCLEDLDVLVIWRSPLLCIHALVLIAAQVYFLKKLSRHRAVLFRYIGFHRLL